MYTQYLYVLGVPVEKHGPIIFIGQEAPTKTPQVLVSNDRIVSSDGCTKPTYCYVLWDIESYTIAFPNSNGTLGG